MHRPIAARIIQRSAKHSLYLLHAGRYAYSLHFHIRDGSAQELLNVCAAISTHQSSTSSSWRMRSSARVAFTT
jgi:hypothetical protein